MSRALFHSVQYEVLEYTCATTFVFPAKQYKQETIFYLALLEYSGSA